MSSKVWSNTGWERSASLVLRSVYASNTQCSKYERRTSENHLLEKPPGFMTHKKNSHVLLVVLMDHWKQYVEEGGLKTNHDITYVRFIWLNTHNQSQHTCSSKSDLDFPERLRHECLYLIVACHAESEGRRLTRTVRDETGVQIAVYTLYRNNKKNNDTVKPLEVFHV